MNKNKKKYIDDKQMLRLTEKLRNNPPQLSDSNYLKRSLMEEIENKKMRTNTLVHTLWIGMPAAVAIFFTVLLSIQFLQVPSQPSKTSGMIYSTVLVDKEQDVCGFTDAEVAQDPMAFLICVRNRKLRQPTVKQKIIKLNKNDNK